MQKQPTIAVIGLGYWGPNLVRNFYEHPGFELRWACDARPAKLLATQQRYPTVKTTADYNELLNDPQLDAVAIATPVDTHFDLASRALEAGKHVLVEKPMTRTVDEATSLVALAAKAGRVLMVDHTFLFTPAVAEIKRLVTGGELGSLYFIDSVRINLGIFQHDVNVLWDLAPHDLSIIAHVLGRMPRRVSAVGSCHTRSDLADIAHLYLDFGDNLMAHIHSSWLSPVKVRQMVFGGSKRTLFYNDIDPSEKLRLYDAGVNLKENDEEGIQRTLVSYRRGDVLIPHLDLREALNAEVEHFHDAIVNGAPCISGGEFGRSIVRALAAADESLKTGQFVNL